MPISRALAAALCLTVLAGCSNGKFTYATAFRDAAEVLGYGDDEAAEPFVPPTPDEPGPPLIVGFEDIRVALPYAGMSGRSKTYVSPDGVDIAMNQGFVTRATGLGVDLQGMYLTGDSPWLDGLWKAAFEGRSAERTAEYWKEERLERDKFRCTLSGTPREGGGLLVDETCKRYFEDFSFTNRYWLDANAQIECSRQWIHPRLAPLQFFRTEAQATSLDLTEEGC